MTSQREKEIKEVLLDIILDYHRNSGESQKDWDWYFGMANDMFNELNELGMLK